MIFRAEFVVVLMAVFMTVCSSISTVAVTAKGKHFNIAAETVDEVIHQVEQLAGLEAGKQSVLFRGKLLKKSQLIDDLNVKAGESLSVFKRKPRNAKPATLSSGDNTDVIGSSGAADRFAPDQLQKSFDVMLRSDKLDKAFASDEKVEEMRLEVLKAIDSMPAPMRRQMEEIASDAAKWREAMAQVRGQLETFRKMGAAPGMFGK